MVVVMILILLVMYGLISGSEDVDRDIYKKGKIKGKNTENSERFRGRF